MATRTGDVAVVRGQLLVHLASADMAVVGDVLVLVGIKKVKQVRPPERAIHQAQEAKHILKR